MLDPLPSKVLKEHLPTVGPAILLLMNLSLSIGIVPSSFKDAVIKPLLKKPGLDPECWLRGTALRWLESSLTDRT